MKNEYEATELVRKLIAVSMVLKDAEYEETVSINDRLSMLQIAESAGFAAEAVAWILESEAADGFEERLEGMLEAASRYVPECAEDEPEEIA